MLTFTQCRQSGLLNYDEQMGAAHPRQDAFSTQTSFEVKLQTVSNRHGYSDPSSGPNEKQDLYHKLRFKSCVPDNNTQMLPNWRGAHNWSTGHPFSHQPLATNWQVGPKCQAQPFEESHIMSYYRQKPILPFCYVIGLFVLCDICYCIFFKFSTTICAHL